MPVFVLPRYGNKRFKVLNFEDRIFTNKKSTRNIRNISWVRKFFSKIINKILHFPK